jgi:hypothetical protein
MTPATNVPRPRKKTADEKAKAALRLRRRLEDSLFEFDASSAERRIVKVMIDLLYRLSPYDRDIEINTVSVRNLTLKRRLRGAFSHSNRWRTLHDYPSASFEDLRI